MSSTGAGTGEQLSLVRASTRRHRSAAPARPDLAAADPVAVVGADVGLAHLDRPFEYAVPETLAEAALPGARVKVRFAGQDVDGFVLNAGPRPSTRAGWRGGMSPRQCSRRRCWPSARRWLRAMPARSVTCCGWRSRRGTRPRRRSSLRCRPGRRDAGARPVDALAGRAVVPAPDRRGAGAAAHGWRFPGSAPSRADGSGGAEPTEHPALARRPRLEAAAVSAGWPDALGGGGPAPRSRRGAAPCSSCPTPATSTGSTPP